MDLDAMHSRMTSFCGRVFFVLWLLHCHNSRPTAGDLYIGCFEERGWATGNGIERIMSYPVTEFSNSLTIDSCITACRNAGYTYAAGQFGFQCYCGNDFYTVPAPNQCTVPCSGNKTQMCGNGWVNSVYSVCERGFYGSNCQQQCSSACGGRGCLLTGACIPNNCNGTDCNPPTEVCNSLPSSYYCTCQVGYNLTNGYNCTDINECLQTPPPCDTVSQSCINTIGSYYCICRPGFQPMPSDSHNCSDVNECLLPDPPCDEVSQTCTNTIGSYYCTCRPGFEPIPSDSHHCSDINECLTANCGCNEICINTPGSYYCSCRTGFSLKPDNETCTDIDECALNGTLAVCVGNAYWNCTNTIGSYYCSCSAGYAPNSDASSCSSDSSQKPSVLLSTVIALAVLLGFSLIINIVSVVVILRSRRDSSTSKPTQEKKQNKKQNTKQEHKASAAHQDGLSSTSNQTGTAASDGMMPYETLEMRDDPSNAVSPYELLSCDQHSIYVN